MPVGTPMSIPGWQASQGRGSQKGEVTGPLTGQMNPDEVSPCTGPAGGCGVGAACACLGRLELGLDLALDGR